MAAGCQKIQEIINPGHEPVEDGPSVAIRFNTNMGSVETKANGSVTGFGSEHKLYIYGIRSDGTVLMNNVEATAVGVIAPTEDNPAGVSQALTLTSGATYFYTGTTDRYSFYGYYVDDAVEGTPKPDATSYTLPVTITGDQDILLAKADPEKDCEGNAQVYYKHVPEEGKTNSPVYSAWSARRGVTPSLMFEHQLSQLTFSVRNKGSKDVVLESIVVNTINKGVLTVAGASPNLAPDKNAKADLTLKMDPLSLTARTEGYSPVIYTDGDKTHKSAIMTFPDETRSLNTLILTLSQDKQNGTRTVTLPIEEVTAKGYSYEITLTVYSMEYVEANVTLAKWETGDKVVIDTEENQNDVYIPNDNPQIPPIVDDETGNEGGNDDTTGGTDDPTGGNDDTTGGTDDPTGGNDDTTGGTDEPTGGNDDTTDDTTGGNDDTTGGTDGNDDATSGTDAPTGGSDDTTDDTTGSTDDTTGGEEQTPQA